MIADSMTKALQAKQYRDHVDNITAMIHMLYSWFKCEYFHSLDILNSIKILSLFRWNHMGQIEEC